jgi:cytochrome P450
LVPLALGPRSVVLVVDPHLIKPILRASEDAIDKGALVRKLRKVLGLSSLTMGGEAHQGRREVLHQQLSRGMAQNYVPEMCATIRQIAIRTVLQGEFAAADLASQLALKLICIALFGRQVLSDEDEVALVRSVKEIEGDLQRSMFRVLPPSPWQMLKQSRLHRDAREQMAGIVDRVAARARGTSVLSALSSLQLTLGELRDELLTMLIAGYHTTASAAAWLFYCLATHPFIAEQIADEARRVVDTSGEIKPSSLPKASTSLSFVREVLRLYPPAWWMSREVKQDFIVAGRNLRRGTTLIICPWQLHRDPRNFDAPEAFSIERSFAVPAYVPFGSGPRACVGMGVALLELQLMTLELASAFEFHAIRQTMPPKVSAGVILSPPNVMLSMHVRQPRFRTRKVAMAFHG